MIRKALPADLDFFYTLYMHPEVNRFLLYDPMDRASFKPIFEDLQQKGFLYVYTSDNHEVGMFKLIPQSYRMSHMVYLGGLAIHPGFSGKGYGKKMLQEIIAYAGEAGFKRIELTVTAGNDKAMRLYESVGFEKEGLLKKYSWMKAENTFLDEVIMAYFC